MPSSETSSLDSSDDDDNMWVRRGKLPVSSSGQEMPFDPAHPDEGFDIPRDQWQHDSDVESSVPIIEATSDGGLPSSTSASPVGITVILPSEPPSPQSSDDDMSERSRPADAGSEVAGGFMLASSRFGAEVGQPGRPLVQTAHTAESLALQYPFLGAVNPGRDSAVAQTNCVMAAIAFVTSVREQRGFEAPLTEALPGRDLLNFHRQSLGLADDEDQVSVISDLGVVREVLAAAGPGAVALIAVRGAGGGLDHVFVGVVDERGVSFLDPQRGALAADPVGASGLAMLPLTAGIAVPQGGRPLRAEEAGLVGADGTESAPRIDRGASVTDPDNADLNTDDQGRLVGSVAPVGGVATTPGTVTGPEEGNTWLVGRDDGVEAMVGSAVGQEAVVGGVTAGQRARALLVDPRGRLGEDAGGSGFGGQVAGGAGGDRRRGLCAVGGMADWGVVSAGCARAGGHR